jgi:chitinase
VRRGPPTGGRYDPALGQKTAWVKGRGLLGVMIWELSGDTGTLMSAVDTGLR